MITGAGPTEPGSPTGFTRRNTRISIRNNFRKNLKKIVDEADQEEKVDADNEHAPPVPARIRKFRGVDR